MKAIISRDNSSMLMAGWSLLEFQSHRNRIPV
jgi:hypothetical protein